MEQAKLLVRSVARSFFETEHVVCIDAIIDHSALTIDDFKQIFAGGGRQPKEIAQYLGKLRESGLARKDSRAEVKDGAQKHIQVEYWWIDYHYAIDATKYKLRMIQDKLANEAKSTTEKKEFMCKVCHSQWTLMEAMDNKDPKQFSNPAYKGSGFLCKRCNNPLLLTATKTDAAMEDESAVSQFNKQLDHITSLVEAIDNLTVPNITWEMALANKKSVPRQKDPGALDTEPNQVVSLQPASVKGLQGQDENVKIVLTTEEENNAAVQEAKAKEKAKIQEQNLLPEWHTTSTVTGDITRAGHKQSVRDHDALVSAADDQGEKKPLLNNAAMDAVFAQLEAERAQAAKTPNEEGSEEESDEDEFEDVTSPVLKRPRIEGQDSFGDGQTGSTQQLNSVSLAANPGEEDDSEEEEFEEVV